jgi:hypothetical protein
MRDEQPYVPVKVMVTKIRGKPMSIHLFDPLSINRRHLQTLCAAVLMVSSLLYTAYAQTSPPERVSFAKGASSATVNGKLIGTSDSTRDYVVRAKAGQTLKIELVSKSPIAYYNVLPPGTDLALVNTSTTGEPRWSGKLPVDGDYTVRVYLMRSAARQGKTAAFSLTISVLP